MSSPLVAYDLFKSYGHRRVLDGVSLVASPGRRIGLIGENGVGKSTLLRLLAGVEQPDAGDVQRPADCGYLPQRTPSPAGGTVQSVVDEALAEFRTAERRLAELVDALARRPEDAEVLAEYGDVLEWAQEHDLWEAEHRAATVLAGLGLGDLAGARRLSTLSGGQRSRLGLAALLLRRPRALLLDEPTNHLDDEAIGFLERHLAAMPGVVVLASHDRVFLDAVCTDIVDLDPRIDGVARYRGAFSDYLRAKHAERQRWEQRYADEQRQLAQLRHAVAATARHVAHGAPMGNTSKVAYDYKGSRVQKQVSRRVRDARQRLDALTRDQVRKPPQVLRFSAPVTRAATTREVIVQVRRVVVADRLRLDELDVTGDERLLVTGPNGAGKSTLLRLLAGDLTAQEGTVAHRRDVRVGFLRQEVTFNDAHRSARELYTAATASRSKVPPLSELGLLPGRDLDRPVGELSVGQRRRLALAVLVADPPQLLLLDEPTNHLSLALADELEEALHSAVGAVVIATHDRYLRRRWNGRVLALDNGRVRAQ